MSKNLRCEEMRSVQALVLIRLGQAKVTICSLGDVTLAPPFSPQSEADMLGVIAVRLHTRHGTISKIS